ncbi:hypothetical protein [Actinocrispum sp. NPDC049592]|uniref:hypothetical protein n=1 Tax=Actinocrispum sp. NPDC049592 TaxID=3154835 RepID=UPI003438F82A
MANDSKLTQPTHGNLAHDNAFIDEVVQVWQRSVPKRFPTAEKPITGLLAGKPHVYWAADTKAGRAALVLQAVHPERKDDRPAIAGLVGSDPGTGRLAIIGADNGMGLGYEMAYRYGPGGRYLLAFDQGRPLWVSARTTYDTKGKAERAWQELTFADGVGQFELPEGTGAFDAKLTTVDPATATPTLNDQIGIVNTDEAGVLAEKRRVPGLDWGRDRGWATWVDVDQAHQKDLAYLQWFHEDNAYKAGMVNRADRLETGGAQWYAAFSVAPDRLAIVGEVVTDQSGPSHLCTVVLDTKAEKAVDVRYGGPADAKAALPVVVPLADNLRGVVLKGATLRYREGPNAPWQPAGTDAIKIPSAQVQVEIDRLGAAPVIVDVP